MKFKKPSYIIAAVLSMVSPILIGQMAGQIHPALISSLGSLALINEVYEGSEPRQTLVNLIYAAVFSTAAFMIGAAIAGTAIFSLVTLPLVIFAISTIGLINRQSIKNSVRSIVFLIIGYHFELTGKIYLVASAFFLAGTLWTALILLATKLISKDRGTPIKPSKKYTVRQYLNHWIKSLSSFKGWQFPLRITLCITAAQILRYFIPGHHSYWILLTIALVTQYNMDNQLKRIRDRGIGTLLGVCFSFAFVYFNISVHILIPVIAVLASLRVIFRETDYLIYAAVMTPLIIILLDFGNISSAVVLADRLIATIIGGLLSFIFGYLIWRKPADKPGREHGAEPHQ